MRVMLIRSAASIDRATINTEDAPPKVMIGKEIFRRIDDPDTGEFLGAYALIGGQPTERKDTP